MNINDLVTHYVAFRRTLGERFNTTENILRSFCRAVGPRTPVTRIRPKAVAKFLAGTGPVTRTWHFKYCALKGFFQFAVSRGHLDKAPLPTELPKCHPHSSRTFTRAKNFAACWMRSRRTSASRVACRATHAASDLVAAVRGWVAPRGGAEAVGRGRGFGEFPAHHSRYQVLQISAGSHQPGFDQGAERLRPLANRLRILQPTAESHFFVSRRGTAIHHWNCAGCLRATAGTCRRPPRSDGGRYQPRLHDLRHTFAVHRLTEWYRQGADVQRLVYHLSVYLGHARLAHTQVYLTMTPELLQQAGTLLRAVRPRGGQSCVTLPCSARGFAGS